MLKGTLFCFFLLISAVLLAQPAEYKMSPEEYIARYKDAAITEMHLNGIPASITLAQAMLESGNGNSPLAMYANNHFGIKCHSTWNGPTFTLDDDAKDECFRKYRAVIESYKDHSEFIRTRKWYQPLFELKQNDYKGWAHGLKKAGYATHPRYAEMLIDLIESHQLYKFDAMSNAPSKTLTVSNKRSKPQEIERSTEVRNNIKYVIAAPGDSYQKIADEVGVHVELLLKYNDHDGKAILRKGEVVYLQPKKKKGKDVFHILSQGESIRDVSQLHGIRLSRIYKYNSLKPGQEPVPGTKIWLRKQRNN